MKIPAIRTSLIVTLLSGILAIAHAEDGLLMVGDPAPKLQTGKFVQGEPVKEFEPGKAYIVEFWATWCGPCVASIPKLNEIYKKYKDKGLVVMGQNCWENDDALVEPFVKKMKEKMTYSVALDDKEGQAGKMAATWMTAAGQDGIPAAFLVDTTGHIAWIGHPMNLEANEQVIDQVLHAKYDLAKAAADYQKDNKEMLLRAALNTAIKKEDWKVAEAKLLELLKTVPEDQRDNFAFDHFDILMGEKDEAGAYKLATDLSNQYKDNANFQNRLAWKIVSDRKIKNPDLKIAELFTRRALEASKTNDPDILDTMSRVLFMQGKKADAIETEEQAIDLVKKTYQKTLDSYKKDELPKVD